MCQLKATLKIHSRFKGKLSKKMNDALAATMTAGVPKVVEVLSKVAQSKLHSTSKLYVAGLAEAITATTTMIKIKLEGVTKDLESGYPARDMKPKLLASQGVKTGANGERYADVPFRHAIKAGAVRYQSMPPEIKAKVQEAVKAERVSARWSGREERNPLRVTGKLPTQNPKHATSIHSDMIRTKTGAKSTYQTIRRISSNSDAKSWWHPGFEGIKALRQLKNFPRLVLKSIFNRELVKRGLKPK